MLTSRVALGILLVVFLLLTLLLPSISARVTVEIPAGVEKPPLLQAPEQTMSRPSGFQPKTINGGSMESSWPMKEAGGLVESSLNFDLENKRHEEIFERTTPSRTPSSTSATHSRLGEVGVETLSDVGNHRIPRAAWPEDVPLDTAAEDDSRGQAIKSRSQRDYSSTFVNASAVFNRSKKKTSDRRRPSFWSEDIQLGCQGLYARRYITDGYCTSEEPIREVVCAGHCLPIKSKPWYAEFVKIVARSKFREWQCVEEKVRRKRVKLLCMNSKFRHYRIKVVTGCTCKKMKPERNRPHRRSKKDRKKSRRKRRRKGRKNKSGRGS